jgi:rod shape-determining protein MreC
VLQRTRGSGFARRLTKRQRVSAIVLGVIALAFLTLDLGGGSLRGAHTGMRGVLGSLYRGTDAVLGPVRRFIEGVPSAGTNQATIQNLRHDNEKLKAQIAAQAADRRTAKQLNRLQLHATETGQTVLPARVIAFGPGAGFDWTVTIDAGSSSGIRAGQTVTDGYGLVGRVLHADRSSSVVLLAADPGSGVGVRDLRTGEIGVARGEGTDGFTFTPLSPDAKINVGDHIATGPSTSSSFVPGIAIGVVTAVRDSADGTVTAMVDSIVSPSGVDIVGVIVKRGHPPASRDAIKPGTSNNGASGFGGTR